MSDVRTYLTIEEALWLHASQIEIYSGASGIRDRGLLESAILRPQIGYYEDVVAEAAALWESLAMNHPFIDGNKRVAFGCMVTFLDVNGLALAVEPDEAIAFVYSNLEAGTFTMQVLEAWLRENTEPR